MSGIVEPAEKDPDMSQTTCPTGVSEGYREIVRACRHNPDLFYEIISLGTMLHQTANDMTLEAGGDLTLKVGGNLILDVQGTIQETATQHVASKR